MVRVRTCLLFFCSACSHPPAAAPAAPPAARAVACMLPLEQPSSELISRHGTALDTYQLEGGVWLERAPVLFNEDFDFALAMGLESGVGAGLAAARRKENNARKAGSFSALEVPAALHARLRELRCCGLHVYFVLWGAETLALRTVFDFPSDTSQSRVVEGPARPLGGEHGWMSGETLLGEEQRALLGVACPGS